MDSSSPLAAVQQDRRQCARMESANNHSTNEEKPDMKINRIGVDIAKSVFHVHAIDRHGKMQWQAKLKRDEWIAAICEHAEPGTEVGMEACASSHHWGRELQKRGYKVKLIAAQFVKPFVKSNKNDRVDAEAISEAMSRPSMRFVTLKSTASARRAGDAPNPLRVDWPTDLEGESHPRPGRGVRHCCPPRESKNCARRCRVGWKMQRMD